MLVFAGLSWLHPSLTALSITLRAMTKVQFSGGGCQTEGSGIGRRKTRRSEETRCRFESSRLFNNVQACLARLALRVERT